MVEQEAAQSSYSTALGDVLSLVSRDRGPARALDVGCGDGSWMRQVGSHFPGVELVGVDILPATNNMAEAPHISYHCTSGLALPFSSGYFELVHTRKLLSSVAEFEALVAESLRVLAPGGLGVWVEGRNVSTSPDASPALKSTKGGLKGMMAKQLSQKMLESKGLDADLVTSLPRLLEKNGLEQVRCEKLTARDELESDLGFTLDGAVEGSAAMYAFYGRKRPAPAADIGV